MPAPVTSLRGAGTVSLGYGFGLAGASPAFASVPNLAGATQAAAGQQLQAVGLVLGPVTKVIDNMCNHLGQVISQNPAAGSTVSFGTAVSVTIGAPPAHPCP